jgi:hypothetical protein
MTNKKKIYIYNNLINKGNYKCIFNKRSTNRKDTDIFTQKKKKR